MSYGIVAADHYRQAALYVDKILRGAKPADLPVQVPVKYETALNVKTAKAFGLYSAGRPDRRRRRSDRVSLMSVPGPWPVRQSFMPARRRPCT